MNYKIDINKKVTVLVLKIVDEAVKVLDRDRCEVWSYI